MKYGCSIMLDGWTDRKIRMLINFLVNYSLGTMFVKSIDASEFMKTGAKSKLLLTPHAAHCLDLILEDIGKIAKVKKVIQRGIKLVGYIYKHSLALNIRPTFSQCHFFPSERHSAATSTTIFLATDPTNKNLLFPSNCVPSTKKLDKSNYATWASNIMLWISDQEYTNHITNTINYVTAPDMSLSPLSIHPSNKFSNLMSHVSVWSKACTLCTNDTQHFYGVCHDLMTLIAPQKLDGPMSAYIGRACATLHDLDELLPPTTTNPAETKRNLKMATPSCFLSFMACLQSILLSMTKFWDHL
ncbi:hypothetical protein CR513_37594, partial [Mucuna pruriens]